MTVKARHNLDSVQDKIENLEADILELRSELEAEADAITVRWADALERTSTVNLKPRRADVEIHTVGLAWAPNWMFEYVDGGEIRLALMPAYVGQKPI